MIECPYCLDEGTVLRGISSGDPERVACPLCGDRRTGRDL